MTWRKPVRYLANDVASNGAVCGPYYQYHNQWDLAGVMFYQDEECSAPMAGGVLRTSTRSTLNPLLPLRASV
jgi:hypothetical protein